MLQFIRQQAWRWRLQFPAGKPALDIDFQAAGVSAALYKTNLPCSEGKWFKAWRTLGAAPLGQSCGISGTSYNCLFLSQSQSEPPLCHWHVQPVEVSKNLPEGDGGAGQVCSSGIIPGVNPKSLGVTFWGFCFVSSGVWWVKNMSKVVTNAGPWWHIAVSWVYQGHQPGLEHSQKWLSFHARGSFTMLPCSLPWEVLETGSLQSVRAGDTSWSRAGSSPLLLSLANTLEFKYSNFVWALFSDSETLHNLIQS